ncbi:P-loop containing nucleoside triphosphate hydrolase protein [Baffinella frigidus]|nr:P-loop containing nucleoside triphosphate hydrolase protein [Cryptophyta sp. CCMP2293]
MTLVPKTLLPAPSRGAEGRRALLTPNTYTTRRLEHTASHTPDKSTTRGLNLVLGRQDDRRLTVSENLPALNDPRAEDPSAGNFSSYTFTFDHVYSEDSDQQSVYNNTARDAVLSSLSGYNASIIAYGQTGTGKTYTMEGEPTPRLRGIIPRATEEIFGYIENAVSERKKFLVRASYLQIYNEVISDLLKPERTNLHIREDKRRGVFVEGLSEWVVRSPKEVYGLMQRGAVTRATASTKMNEISSRSHAVFIIIAEQGAEAEGKEGKSQAFKVGKLNLVDLAGSERVRLTGATGRRLEESKKINQSLSALGNVIAALTDAKGRQHIPYRDSKLTRILEDSLGGNCKTTMMAMISPALESFPESLSTLKFANRAKNIKNEARVNEDLDQRGLLRKYELEIRKLRSELDSKSKEIQVLHLEELRRRAEADKVAALSALEERSKEFMREKQEKRKLEHKLHSMSSQLLIGGVNVESTPAFRTALRTEHDRIHKEYLQKMEDLERERTVLEEDKVQVDRYKQLLIKQRDIMIALTSRLNERDDTIMKLQEELDAYDRHQRMMEVLFSS